MSEALEPLHFRFCPFCGSSNPLVLAEREMRCPSCRQRFFFNTAASAGAFLFQSARLILCVRAHPPGLGFLDVPGGFIEFEESLEDGLRREIQEEIGASVGPLTYLCSAPNQYLFEGVRYRTLDAFFMGSLEASVTLLAKDDVASIQRLDPRSINPADFAFESTRLAFQKLLREIQTG